MTQKDKELLLKDLCMRLPYGVICEFKRSTLNVLYNNIYDNTLTINNIEYVVKDDSVVRPYLRPMPSMTESEASDMFNVIYPKHKLINVEIEKDRVRFSNKDEYSKYYHITLFFNQIYSLEQLDYLNEHHFDHRHLIEKNLALDCTGLHIYD